MKYYATLIMASEDLSLSIYICTAYTRTWLVASELNGTPWPARHGQLHHSDMDGGMNEWSVGRGCKVDTVHDRFD